MHLYILAIQGVMSHPRYRCYRQDVKPDDLVVCSTTEWAYRESTRKPFRLRIRA